MSSEMSGTYIPSSSGIWTWKIRILYSFLQHGLRSLVRIQSKALRLLTEGFGYPLIEWLTANITCIFGRIDSADSCSAMLYTPCTLDHKKPQELYDHVKCLSIQLLSIQKPAVTRVENPKKLLIPNAELLS